jgi:hypothetical protein
VASGRSPLRALLPAAILATLVACGSAVPATTASPSPQVTPSPSPSQSATPSPSPSPSPSASPLPRNGRIEMPTEGYAIVLPSNWFRLEMTPADVQTAIEMGLSVLDKSQQTALLEQMARMAASRVSLFAFRAADSKAAFGTSMNVMVLPSFDVGLDSLEQLNLEQLKGILGTKVRISHTRVTLPSGQAIRFAYTFKAPQGVAVIVQYLVLLGDRQVIMSFTAPNTVKGVSAEFESIARSLEPIG